jgi:hypothetical protein
MSAEDTQRPREVSQLPRVDEAEAMTGERCDGLRITRDMREKRGRCRAVSGVC